MEEYTPKFLENLNAAEQMTALSLINPALADAVGSVKPIEYYSNYRFTDPKEAVRFMQSKDFTGFWDRTGAGEKNIGVRAEINDARRYNPARPKQTYGEAMKANAESLARTRAKDYARVAQYGGSPSPDSVYEANARYNAVKERSVGRFYSNLFDKDAVKDVSHYLNSANANAPSQQYPIRVIADKRYSGFSLAGRQPYDGLIDPKGMSHEDALFARRALDLSRRTGTDLGAALSSNPRSESFVSSSLARPVSEGGASRVAGRVNTADGVVTVVGKPKIPINTQVVKNILPYIGGAMTKAGPFLGVVGTGLMAYHGYKDYNSDNMMTREYGATDPFGLRAGYDFGINTISGSQSIPQAWETQRRLVEDPEWQMRNPMVAPAYNLVHGNLEPAKAFLQGYLDLFK
jgi:hypothetical protein